MSNSDERLEIHNRISLFEKEKRFNEDVENDPPTIPLKPEDVDYLKVKFKSKVNRIIANISAKKFLNSIIKNKQLIIKDIIGMENAESIKGGFVLTCNHFNPFDNFALRKTFLTYLKKTKRRFYTVIREGNYSFPGKYGYFFRNCDTLPLSSNFETMKNFTRAVDSILKNGDIVQIYPEQAMWWNYNKPRPLKPGAFKYAVKANVPVLPCFITLEDSNILDENNEFVKEYTVFILKPIYPDQNLSIKDRENLMSKENFEMWKETYESFYKIPLEYGE